MNGFRCIRVPPPRRVASAATTAAAALLLLSALDATGQAPPSQPSAPPASAAAPRVEQSIEDEVLQNIQTQGIGTHRFADYDYPVPFLRSFADRIIRASYEKNYRIVVYDDPDHTHDHELAARRADPAHPETHGPASAPAATQPAPAIRIVRSEVDAATRAWRASLTEGHPPLRGFRAPLASAPHPRWPFEPPPADAPAELRRAEDLVGERLTHYGLLPTLALAIEVIGPRDILSVEDPLERLRQVGVPTDWLACFHAPDHPSDPHDLVMFLAQRLADGEKAATLKPELDVYDYAFSPTRPGFRVADESGQEELASLRLQLTRGTHWLGAGDGGSLDMFLQLLDALPAATFFVSIEARHLDDLKASLRGTPLHRDGRLTVAVEPLPVAQWAADNGKVGVVEGGAPAVVTLAPRFASRGEDASTFVPGESFVLDALEAQGHAVLQSPLLFQGGNLIAVRDPASGRRMLLIGEAEILRNTPLGLNRAQILEAFRVEFGVDECIELPAASYHIDYELCVRAIDGKLVAFVNDDVAAANIVLARGLDVLESRRLMDEPTAARAREHLKAGAARELIPLLGTALMPHTMGFGRFRESLARHFVDGPSDSGVANFQQFLLAIDILLIHTLTPDEVPTDWPGGYLRAMRRATALRTDLRRQIEALGWRVVPVPSIAAADRSMNYLNGVHARDLYLMPAWGGLYRALDEAAAAVFRRECGPSVKVIPILASESQRRNGAVRCSLGVYPKR